MADNVQIIKNLFSDLEGPLFLGDRLGQGDFSVLMQPGQFVSLNLTEQDSSEDMAIQYELTNTALDTSFVFKQLTSTIGQVYKDILSQTALPHKDLDQATLDKISEIRQWIADNQSTYTTFKGYYFDAQDAYETEASSQHPNPSKLRRLQSNVDDAYKVFLPYKRDWDNNNGLLIQLIGEDPSALWNDFRTLLQFHTKQAPRRGEFLQTFFIPSISEWASANTSWGSFEKIVTDSQSSSYSHSTAWSGGLSGGWGLFSFGGGASGSSQYQHQSSDTSAINVKFEYLRVRIDRRWLTPDIFGYKFWTWKNTFASSSNFPYISDGGNLAVDPPIRPIGRMPFLPNYMVVVRNVELAANFSHNDQTFIASQLTTSASAGWGPFSISGSYSESTSESHAKASFDGTTLKIAQPQIIAFTGILLPKTPDPDQHLPWTGDQVFPSLTVRPHARERLEDLQRLLVEVSVARRRAQIAASADLQIQSFARAAEVEASNVVRSMGGSVEGGA